MIFWPNNFHVQIMAEGKNAILEKFWNFIIDVTIEL